MDCSFILFRKLVIIGCVYLLDVEVGYLYPLSKKSDNSNIEQTIIAEAAVLVQQIVSNGTRYKLLGERWMDSTWRLGASRHCVKLYT